MIAQKTHFMHQSTSKSSGSFAPRGGGARAELSRCGRYAGPYGAG